MTTSEPFKGFTYQENDKQTQAAIDTYGQEVIEEAIARHKGKEEELTDGFNRLLFAFRDNQTLGLGTDDTHTIELARQLHQHICKYSFDCSSEIFSKIGYGYAMNLDLKNNLDPFGEGVAQYVCDAIQAYVQTESK